MGTGGDTPPGGLPALRSKHALPCPTCGVLAAVERGAREFSCYSCRAKIRLARCSHCRGTLLASARINKAACPYCKTWFQFGPGTDLTAGDLVSDPDATHPDRRALVGCTVIGGYGTGARPNTQCTLRFELARIEIDWGTSQPVVVPYDTVVALELGGRGQQRTGGGFIGGGFGLQGAAEGMIIASLLNGLTTRTTTESIISLKTNDWQLILFYGRAIPDHLRIDLAPAFGRIHAAQRALANTQVPPAIPPPPPPATPNLAAEIRQLAELHREGTLTNEEFEAAKARLISGTSGVSPPPPPPPPPPPA
jgi:hypothetical protein